MRRICNLASTDSRSPSIFIGCAGRFFGFFGGFLVNDFLAVLTDDILVFFILLINRSHCDVTADVGCIDVGLAVQAVSSIRQILRGFIDDSLNITDVCRIFLIGIRDGVTTILILFDAIADIGDLLTTTVDTILGHGRAVDCFGLAFFRNRRLDCQAGSIECRAAILVAEAY